MKIKSIQSRGGLKTVDVCARVIDRKREKKLQRGREVMAELVVNLSSVY